MSRRILKNKPLVEAIFELRWELKDLEPGRKIDPHYKILIGSIYEKIKDEYSFHEQLLSATIPDELIPYGVQHRFRKGKNQWPLIQIGPGIVTLNDTEDYTWDDFERRIFKVVDTIFGVYPISEELAIKELILRYIDAIDFDFNRDSIFDFLKENMKITIDVNQELFNDTGVSDLPSELNLNFAFPSKRPEGIMHLRLMRGKREGKDALIWEIIFQSIGEDAPKNKDQIIAWANEAHELTVYTWFFKIIEGNLERRFE